LPIVSHYSGPLLTRPAAEGLLAARDAGAAEWTGSLDLGRSNGAATLQAEAWQWRGQRYPYAHKLKDRTIHYWDGDEFAPVSRYAGSLIKLVLDTCGGLGYFAACCLEAGVARIQSFEKNADVLWLRTLNPWSPDPAASEERLQLEHADVAQAIKQLADASFDALLHDPPRFGIAGELYSQAFYDQLARVLRRGGRLFHYTGSPNKLTSGRDVPREVAKRLEKAGFKAQLALDGVLAIRR
jgi:predicted methyltransferase